VLQDWNSGRLRYYTHPPEQDDTEQQRICSSEILSQYNAEFSLDQLQKDHVELVDGNNACACDVLNHADMPDMPTIDAIAIDNADDEEMTETVDDKVSTHVA
jgi:hypothetical protein